jgi:hypothetical protein
MTRRSDAQPEAPRLPPPGRPLTPGQKELIRLLARAAAEDYLKEEEENQR